MTKQKKLSTSASSSPKKTVAGGSLSIVGRAPRPNLANDVELGPDRFLDSKMIKLSDYLYETKVETSTVRENLAKFLTQIGDVVADAPQIFGAYELHEIEISAELSVSGELKLLGFGGADIEGTGGLKFLIRRTSSSI